MEGGGSLLLRGAIVTRRVSRKTWHGILIVLFTNQLRKVGLKRGLNGMETYISSLHAIKSLEKARMTVATVPKCSFFSSLRPFCSRLFAICQEFKQALLMDLRLQ